MSEQNLTPLDHLTMNKDSIQMYIVDQLPIEFYSQGTLDEAVFPVRSRTSKDLPEIQQLGQISHDLEQLMPQLHKLEQALARVYDDAERQSDIQNDPHKQVTFEELETYYRQLQLQQSLLNDQRAALLTHCFQLFVQYITIVPDDLVESWRYDKGYLLVFLKQRPTYFNADSDKVTFSALWRYDELFTVRGKINDFFRKIYFEFIVIWRE